MRVTCPRLLFAALVAATLCCGNAAAEVRLPALFGDHMVLQREQPIRVWGWAAPGEPITIDLG
ncbi:MAG: 9-O-acetylesterase, partial [Candidatus Latescibacterota bacterium]